MDDGSSQDSKQLNELPLSSKGPDGVDRETPVRHSTSPASDQPASEAALQESEARYRRLFVTALDSIVILKARSGIVTDANPSFSKLLGYPRSELKGRVLWDIGLFKDMESSRIIRQQLLDKKYVHYDDLELRAKGGKRVDVEFMAVFYGVNSQKAIQCNIRDITAKKAAAQCEEQLRQAQKMESIGRLAGGVAHDFNNLLGGILGYCALLIDDKYMSEPNRRMVLEVRNAATTAANLTRHLLAFSRQQVLEPSILNVNEIIRRIEAMLGRMIGADIQLVSNLETDLGTVKADPSQIEQIMMNLVINARDAMPGGGKILIKTENVVLDQSYVRQHPYAEAGQYVMLAVTDTGIGMDRETQSHIFEPFFSTKPLGKGTGLGLSTVFGIVKQSEGLISVYSEPGHGTSIKIYFPRRTESAPVAFSQKPIIPRGGTETILLVDDEPALRYTTKRLLEDCGYTVLDSGDPTEALAVAGQYKDPIPLMMTDMVMPAFSGSELAKKIAEVRPEMRVLFTSGYAKEDISDLYFSGQKCAFLQKPFARDDLISKIRNLLDEI